MTVWITTFTSFVFALTHTLLLSRFIPRKGGMCSRCAAALLFPVTSEPAG